MKTAIANYNRRYRPNRAFIKKIIVKILKLIKRPLKMELEVVFLDDKRMRELNRRYKNKDRATDVLSFRIEREEFGSEGLLGEIFISLDTALRNSKIFKIRFEDEIALYIIHGLLHIFGYDDRTRKEKSRMSKRQNHILRGLCEKEDLSKVLTPL